jgi:hypothetical protein
LPPIEETMLKFLAEWTVNAYASIKDCIRDKRARRVGGSEKLKFCVASIESAHFIRGLLPVAL